MQKINLWDSPQKDNYLFFNNIKEYLNYLTYSKKSLDFIIKSSSNETSFIDCSLDKYSHDNDIEYIYTDDTHPIAVNNEKTFINPNFFKRYIDVFKRYALKEFEKQLMKNECHVIIPSFILTDSLINILTFTKRNKTFYLKDFGDGKKLTDNQKNSIKNNFIAFENIERNGKKESIGSKYVINHYTLDELKSNQDIIIELPTSKDILNRMVHIGENANIILKMSATNIESEATYYYNIKKVFNILSKVNHSFNIKINVNNRVILAKSNLLNSIPKNIKLSIENNRYTYGVKAYLKEEEKLNKLINPIKNSNLSPFEKYIAVYNIVKKFKPYKEHPCSNTTPNCQSGKALPYILNNDYEYMDCEGYGRLLKVLLNKINIPCQEITAYIDMTRDDDYDESKDKPLGGHDRNMVLINDDKYNIHGYYIADATFDNITDFDLYLNCLMTFDRKKEARRLETLQPYDLLLDFHNFNEFEQKINFFLRRKAEEISYYSETEKIQYAYMQLYKNILRLIKNLDYNEYRKLYNKYNQYLTDYTLDISKLEKIASEMLTEYAAYILPLTNNKIDFETIMSAAAIVKKKINNYSPEEVKSWYEETIKNNKEVSLYTLPYIYNYDNKTEAFVTDVPDSIVKKLAMKKEA